MNTKKKEIKCNHFWQLARELSIGVKPHLFLFCAQCLTRKIVLYEGLKEDNEKGN